MRVQAEEDTAGREHDALEVPARKFGARCVYAHLRLFGGAFRALRGLRIVGEIQARM